MPKHTGLLDHDDGSGTVELFHRLHDGDWAFEVQQPLDFIADVNAFERNHMAKPFATEVKRVARVPLVFIEVWKKRYGVDYWSRDPAEQKRIDRILDDPEWSWMKTTDAKLY